MKSCLTESAWAATRTKGTYLRAKYDSLVVRRGKKRALIAVGHKILIASYHILKNEVPYKELGGEFLTSLKAVKRLNRIKQELETLGYEVLKKESTAQIQKAVEHLEYQN